jgi:DNA-binding beta-propeller fold protein YncE
MIGRLTRLMLLPLLAVAIGLAGATAPTHADEKEAKRLFVVDASRNMVIALNPEDGTTVGMFSMPGPTTLNASSSGRWVYALQTGENRMTVIDSGLKLVSHGDHDDLSVGPPYVRGTVVTGRRPIDFWSGSGMATVHNDDDGTLVVFDDKRLEVALDYTEIRGMGTGHNNAVVLDGTVLLSHASSGRVAAYGMDNTMVTMFEGCPGAHGWTVRGMTAAVGCTDGVLLITKGATGLTSFKVGEPAGSPETARVSTIRSHERVPVMWGNFGQALARFAPGQPLVDVIPLPANPVRFEFNADGDRLVVLTADGQVHTLDPNSGRVLTSVAAVAAVRMGTPAPPRPSIAVGEDTAYATDPTTGEVVVISVKSGQIERRIRVGGEPASIALIRMGGEQH